MKTNNASSNINYKDFNSLQHFLDSVSGNNLSLNKTPIDRDTLYLINTIRSSDFGYGCKYGNVLNNMVYTYVPKEINDYYGKMSYKPILIERDYKIINSLIKNDDIGELIEGGSFKDFDYGNGFTSFKIFYSTFGEKISFKNLKYLTTQTEKLINANDCTFNDAKKLTKELKYLKGDKFKNDLIPYIKNNKDFYFDYKRRDETVKYIEGHVTEFTDFICSNERYFKSYILKSPELFSDYIISKNEEKDYTDAIFENIYNVEKFSEFALSEKNTKIVPFSALIKDEYKFYSGSSEYLKYCIKIFNDNPTTINTVNKDVNRFPKQVNEKNPMTTPKSRAEKRYIDSESSEEEGYPFPKKYKNTSKSAGNPTTDETVTINGNDNRIFLDFILRENSINVKDKAHYTSEFEEIFRDFFTENYKKLYEYNSALTVMKTVCMKYFDLLKDVIVDSSSCLSNGENMTMAMYYIKIFKEDPPFCLKHDPIISHDNIEIAGSKLQKPLILSEVWKKYIGDISIPDWIKTQKGFNEMRMKHFSEENEIKTVTLTLQEGLPTFLILYQTKEDASNNLPYYKISHCSDIVKKIATPSCKSCKVFFSTTITSKEQYENISSLIEKYIYDKKKGLYTGSVNEIINEIANIKL